MTLIIKISQNTILKKAPLYYDFVYEIIDEINEIAKKPVVIGYREPQIDQDSNSIFYSIEFIDGESEKNISEEIKNLDLNLFLGLEVNSLYLKQEIVVNISDSAKSKEKNKDRHLDDEDIIHYIEKNAEIEISKKNPKIYGSKPGFVHFDVKNLKNFEKLKNAEKCTKIIELNLNNKKIIPYTEEEKNKNIHDGNENITELEQPILPSTDKRSNKHKATVTFREKNTSILRFKDRDDAIKNATESDYIEITNILIDFMTTACHTLSTGFQKNYDDAVPESNKDNTFSEKNGKKASDEQSEQSSNTTTDRENQSNTVDEKEPNVNQLPDAETKSDSDQNEDKSCSVDDVSTTVEDTDQEMAVSANQVLSESQENTDEETTNSQDNQ